MSCIQCRNCDKFSVISTTLPCQPSDRATSVDNTAAESAWVALRSSQYSKDPTGVTTSCSSHFSATRWGFPNSFSSPYPEASLQMRLVSRLPPNQIQKSCEIVEAVDVNPLIA